MSQILNQIKQPAHDVLDKIRQYANDNRGLLTGALAAAGAGGLAGGFLSSQTKERPGESRGSRRLRILRDALMMGGAAGGATMLGGEGYKHLSNALPANDVDPVTNIFTSPFGRGTMAAGAGGTGWLFSKRLQNQQAWDLLQRAKHVAGEDPGNRKWVKSLDVAPSQARAQLHAIWNSKNDDLKQLIPQEHGDQKILNHLGVEPSPHFQGGITHLLPDSMGNPLREQLSGLGARMSQSKVMGPVLDRVGPYAKRMSKAIHRYPGVSAMALAGAMTPEIQDALLSTPGIPSPFHRD